jgi:hypothetical protein
MQKEPLEQFLNFLNNINMKLKNKKVGARVSIREVTVAINPKVKWKTIKNVTGVIVERGDYEQYYHTSNGGHTTSHKHVIKNDCYTNYAIKLDNDMVDIEGNNIIVVRELYLKFLDFLPSNTKIISKSEYNKALKLIEKYEYQQTLI